MRDNRCMHEPHASRYLEQREAEWSRLERMLGQIEHQGVGTLSMGEARRFARLYRRVSSDLAVARSSPVQDGLSDYLNDLVARAYAVMHAETRAPAPSLRKFLLVDFPRRFRREWRLVAVAAAIMLAGAVTGALCVARDPFALGALIPPDHQAYTPAERVQREALEEGKRLGDDAAAFSGWLFTHNMEVSLLVLALGLTFGLGTLCLLFFNGVPLGALAMQYHLAGQDPFFWAWILPHATAELTVVWIAGGAGLVIARGLWFPGRHTRTAAVAREAREATLLALGALPLLAVAGAIEATISQMHPPVLPYAAKLVFAVGLAAVIAAFLTRAGRPAPASS
jgi:uncharacterized membrane protein SpoIIM required for sporulation